MRYLLAIVVLSVACAAAALAPAARAEETDCEKLELEVRLDEYLPTWCYYDFMTDGDARAQFEVMFVEGTASYAMVVSAQAFAWTYLPRQSLESLIGRMLEDEGPLDWREGVGVDGYTVKRFAIIEESGRETNCAGFNENTAAPNGRPRTRLYGYLCHVGRGEIEDGNLASFIAAIDG